MRKITGMNSNNAIVLVFALIKLIIPFVFIDQVYDLHRDEYLYLVDAQHLAWGYIEMPPMLAILGRVSLWMGHGEFTVRIWSALFGALTVVLVGKIINHLRGDAPAMFIGCLAFLLSGFLRIHILFQPNFLDAFFWTLSSYLIMKWLDSEQSKYLYYLGICFGLGMLSKYTMAFYIMGFWLAVLLTTRSLLVNKHFYFAMLLAFAIVLPNFWWQVSHHFPVAHHMDLLQRQQLQYLSRVEFILGQFLMTLPCFFIWIRGLGWLLFWRSGNRYLPIAIVYLFIIVILLILHGKHYYAISIYPTLLAIGAASAAKTLSAKRLRYWQWGVPVIMILLAIPLVPIALPFEPPEQMTKIYQRLSADKSGALKWEDGVSHPIPQDFADMQGWKELAQKADKAWQTLDSGQKAHGLIFCDNYGQAGAVTYYGKRYHLPDAFSDNASFLYWLPQKQHIDNLVLVTDDRQEMSHPFIRDFKEAILYDSIVNPYARESGSLIIVLKGANEQFNDMFRHKIEKDRLALEGR